MQDKILKKYRSVKAVGSLQNRIIARSKQLKFGNKISLSQIKILNVIFEILNNEENFINCDICNGLKNQADITENFNNDNNVCQDCQDNYYNYCNDCNIPIYNEGISGRDFYILENEFYCNDCYFKVKQDLYKKHIIKNEILNNFSLSLKKVNYNNLKNYYFKIEGNLYSIERYAKDNYRLGSWGANSWIDIGNNEKYLLNAIDYNLGNNFNKLTNISQ